jgi:MIP family channel proteins
MNKLAQGSIVEFLGTFALVFVGAGSIIVAAGEGGGLVSIALAHGLILSIAITCGMYVSGGQFNPAVAIGLVVAGKQSGRNAGVFIVAQLVGAACGAGMLQVLLTPAVANAPAVSLGATIGSLTKAGDVTSVLGFEAIMTFALMMAVLAGTVDDRAHRTGGFTIGLTLAACIFVGGPLTGASLNPARTFGPAVCGGHWDMHWVYWVGPILGAVVAAGVYKAVWQARVVEGGGSR